MSTTFFAERLVPCVDAGCELAIMSHHFHVQRTQIGYRSVGWWFNFYGGEAIRSWLDWQIVLIHPEVIIIDNRGGAYTFDEFAAAVEQTKTASRRGCGHYPLTRPPWQDEEGFCFQLPPHDIVQHHER